MKDAEDLRNAFVSAKYDDVGWTGVKEEFFLGKVFPWMSESGPHAQIFKIRE